MSDIEEKHVRLEAAPRFCVGCVHYSEAACNRLREDGIDLVTGKPFRSVGFDPSFERYNERYDLGAGRNIELCGAEGKFWEAKL